MLNDIIFTLCVLFIYTDWTVERTILIMNHLNWEIFQSGYSFVLPLSWVLIEKNQNQITQHSGEFYFAF